MHQAPFTIYYTFRPKGNNRVERLRHAQKLAVILFSELRQITSIAIALPGGSQNALWQIHNFTDVMYGLQVKPQFGESPAQLVITGFYAVPGSNMPSFQPAQQVFAGRYVGGPVNSHLAMGATQPYINLEVVGLKALFDGRADYMNSFYTDLNMKVWRLEYKGIIWGDRGLHFPRP